METPLAAYASYLPRLLVDALSADPSPSTEPRAFELHAAVFFADIAGFTRLTEWLARKGPAGIEELTERLNAYFGQLIELIDKHGGDTVKFAGDALLALWTAPSEAELATAMLRATQCAVAVQAELQDHISPDDPLKLRINLSCGTLQAMEVGGVFGRWELVFSGEPLMEITDLRQRAEIGRVAVSPRAWRLIGSRCRGEPYQQSVQVDEIVDAVPVSPTPPVQLFPAMERGLRAYIPGAILARMSAGQSSWLAELRQITVLFVNLPSFGQATQVGDTQRIMASLQQAIYRYEGSLNKLSVDDKGITLVAAYGLPPLTHEDDACRALQAAFELQDRLLAHGHFASIGVATGLAFCGSIGSAIRREYTMMGDVVNLAARLMQAANQDLLCDAATQRLAQGRLQFEELPAILVKGKREPVHTFRPLGSVRPRAQTQHPLVGRLAEREVIRSALGSLQAGQGGAVFFEGEAGIGKSRLLDVARELATGLGIRRLEAFGDAIEKSVPFHACRSLIARLLEVESFWDDADMRRQRVLARLERHPDLLRLAPLLNVVLLLELPDNDSTAQMDGKSRSDKTLELLVRLLSAEAAQRPLLIVVEDAHWLDSGSWSVLSLVNRTLSNVLLFIASRPIDEPRPAELSRLRGQPTTRDLRLATLTAEDTATIVAQALGVRSVPAGLARWIFARVEGHPFFSEELALAMRDAGMVRVTDGEIHMTCRDEHLDAVDFPTTIQGVITSRLDRLPPQELMVVKTASVIGRTFGYNVLSSIYPIEEDKPQLPGYLDALRRRSITTLDAPGLDPSYAFKHALIQDVAYNQMLFVQRRQLHQAIAEWYELAYADDLSPMFSPLAHHWEKAGAMDRARDYLERAGDLGLRNGTFQEAVGHLTRALESIETGSQPEQPFQEAILERKLARAYLGLGRLPEALQHSRRALQLLGEREPVSTLGGLAALLGQAVSHLWRRLFDASLPARKLSHNDAAAANQEPKPLPVLEMAGAYEHLSEIHYYSNDTLGFLYACLRTVNLAERAPASPELARGHANMGVTAGLMLGPRQANWHLRRATQIADRAGHAAAAGWVQLATAVYAVGIGRFQEARDAVDRGCALFETAGDERQLGVLRAIHGASWYFSGEFQRGVADWELLHGRAHRRGDVLLEAWGFGGLALNYVRLGQLDTAVRHAESALELFRTNADHISEISTLGVLAVARLRQGKIEAARSAAHSATLLINQLGWPTAYYLLEGYSAVAEVALFAPDGANSAAARTALRHLSKYAYVFPIGQPREQLWIGYRRWQRGAVKAARRSWRKGLAQAEKLGMMYEAGLCHFALGRHAPPDAPERNAHLTAAATIFRDHKAAFDLEQAEDAIRKR